MTKPRAWLCHTCGERFTAWATAERHADQHHHHRLDVELPR